MKPKLAPALVAEGAVEIEVAPLNVLSEMLAESVYKVLIHEGLTEEIHSATNGQQLNVFINSSCWEIAEKVHLVLRQAGRVVPKLGAPTNVAPILLNQKGKEPLNRLSAFRAGQNQWLRTIK